MRQYKYYLSEVPLGENNLQLYDTAVGFWLETISEWFCLVELVGSYDSVSQIRSTQI
jgi:hypothetical protein